MSAVTAVFQQKSASLTGNVISALDFTLSHLAATMEGGSGASIVPFFSLIISNVSAFTNKYKDERAIVGVFCSLSIIGSLLIILSYFLQKNKTKARIILFHVSLMDLGVGLANLIGLSVYFDQFFNFSKDGIPLGFSKTMDSLCKVQAFFAQFCTLASILWTTSLAGYLYFVILHHNRPLYAIYFMRFSYFCCYGLPFGVSLWACLTEKLGYAPYDSAGWCSLITKDPLNVKKRYPFAAIFGCDIWMFLAGFLIIVLYVDIRIFLSQQEKLVGDSRQIPSRAFWSSLNHVDYKFIFIPIIFILLRVWTVILSILYVYLSLREDNIPPLVNKTLIFLSGIGDSAQGFTNAILFIFLTKTVRRSIVRCMCCKYDQFVPENTTSHFEHSVIQSITSENGTRQSYVTPLLTDSSKFTVSTNRAV